ncbi:NrfD/PsrC family molybdoenzyme membrane anchor subunit [Vibrio fluvialis]|uniref:NrfD/PsrC family molybdoenzyme membrane anchor subunit n=1 Tax=Vibrio fluvialis TaxID=676 RepID=UPI00192C49AB|nr:NrfD/PsrC family molybdoenzyme membrane anchor subunit [Vibrio fluvialis]MBL4281458.1 polysulfide reductase NrfD [Vibrio fluvialis]
MNITEVLVAPQAIAWLPWAVQYFFYIGSAYAAAMLFLIALLFERRSSHRLRAALVLTLAIGAMVGPLALTGDLHQPGRAWHFYAYITPWSWMSLGSLFLPLFSALAVATAWLYLRADLIALQQRHGFVLRLVGQLSLGQWRTSRRLMLLVATLTMLSGLSIALYTGAEIADVSARPLWHQPAAPLLWFVTAFLAAVGFSLFVYLLIPKVRSAQMSSFDLSLLKKSVSLSAVLALILLSIWAANNPTFSLYENTQWTQHLALLTAALLGCIAWAFLSLHERTRGLGLIGMMALSLVAAWLVRWVTMMQVQTIPKFDVGPYPYELPWGANGALGIAGMFGLWLALALLGSELVQHRAQTHPSSVLTHHK